MTLINLRRNVKRNNYDCCQRGYHYRSLFRRHLLLQFEISCLNHLGHSLHYPCEFHRHNFSDKKLHIFVFFCYAYHFNFNKCLFIPKSRIINYLFQHWVISIFLFCIIEHWRFFVSKMFTRESKASYCMCCLVWLVLLLGSRSSRPSGTESETEEEGSSRQSSALGHFDIPAAQLSFHHLLQQ